MAQTDSTDDALSLRGTATYELALEPGEGAILLIGGDEQLRTVRDEYFSRRRRRKPASRSGKIDRLLLGFYTGTSMGDRPERLGLSHDEYIDRMLQLYRDAGATAVFAYHGNLGSGTGRKFAAAAAKFGLPAILQPNDVYFRGQGYWKIDAYRNGLLKGYEGPEDYMRRRLIPCVEEWAPANADAPNILAWGPAEELAPEDEAVYVEYKRTFKRLLPNHLLYQLDSQQSTRERRQSKRPPYPDITGFDRYPWWTRPGETGLWTPHYAARWFFNVTKDYARDSHELFGAPAVLVMQGCAELAWYSAERGEKWGWQQDPDFAPPKEPHCRWVPEFGKYRGMNRYLAPDNAWRLQIWMGLARGYKGFMYWAGGPGSSPEHWREAFGSGKSSRLCLINEDFTCHRHLAEVSQTWRDIRRYEALLLDTHPVSDQALAVDIDGRHLYTGVLEDHAGRQYLVVVNGRIGEWDGASPETLAHPQTKLMVGDMGELVNYTPLKAKRTVRFQLTGARGRPYDLRTMESVRTASGQ